MTPKERAVELLCQGVPTSQVAEALGVDPSYVSQLRADPGIMEKLAASQAIRTLEDVQHDSTIDEAEALALGKIKQTLPFANFGQALAAFKVLNSAERRNTRAQASGAVTQNIQVNLTLPVAALPNYVMNSRSEIVEVEGQTMLTATAKSLDQLLAERAGAKAGAVPKITDTEKAANILNNIGTRPRLSARRAPADFSADLL